MIELLVAETAASTAAFIWVLNALTLALPSPTVLVDESIRVANLESTEVNPSRDIRTRFA